MSNNENGTIDKLVTDIEITKVYFNYGRIEIQR
jgi:hypothetical protein